MIYDFETHYILMRNPTHLESSASITKIKRIGDELLAHLDKDLEIAKQNSHEINRIYSFSESVNYTDWAEIERRRICSAIDNEIAGTLDIEDAEAIYIDYLKRKSLIIHPESWFLQNDILFSLDVLIKYIPNFASEVDSVNLKEVDGFVEFELYDRKPYFKIPFPQLRQFHLIERKKLVEIRNVLEKAYPSEKNTEIKNEISRMIYILASALSDTDSIFIFYYS